MRPVQKWYCDICGTKFYDEQKYKKHIASPKCKNVVLGRKILTKEFLEENLKKYSANYIAEVICKELGYSCGAGRIIDKAKEFGIHTHSFSEANHIETSIKLRQQTCLERYGAPSIFSKESTNRQQWERKMFEEEGITNVRQRESVKQKIRETNIKKYGVPNYTLTDQYRKKRCNGRMSKLHLKISNYLTQNNIQHQNEKTIVIKDQNGNIITSPIVDILVQNKKVIFQIYGDRWHLNPKFYKPNDLINFLWINKKNGPMTVRQIWDLQNKRNQLIQKEGYKVIILWEYDINNDFQLIQEQIEKVM